MKIKYFLQDSLIRLQVSIFGVIFHIEKRKTYGPYVFSTPCVHHVFEC